MTTHLDTNYSNSIQYTPRFLWFITLTYTMITVISNWFDARLVEVFSMAISPGTLIFPLTFLLSDIITEVYGYKYARRAILTAFLFNIIFLMYGQLIVHMPSPSFSIDNTAFDKLLTINKRIVIASFISYLISEPINSFIVAKMKIATKGQYMAIRFLISTLFAVALDSLFFITIAFYGIIATQHLITLIFNIGIIKVCIEVIGLSFSIRLSKFLKRKEQLDIYDYDTRFSLYKLNTQYDITNNRYSLTQEEDR